MSRSREANIGMALSLAKQTSNGTLDHWPVTGGYIPPIEEDQTNTQSKQSGILDNERQSKLSPKESQVRI
jgi:hypothetical protein